MNPNQGSGNTPESQSSLPKPMSEPVTDIPEDAFGFIDDSPRTDNTQSAKQPAALLAPTQPASVAPPQAVQPVVHAPIPSELVPTTSPPRAVPVADIMPPPIMPAVPTLTPPVVSPAAPLNPAPIEPLVAEPVTPQLKSTFDPRAVPVHASSTSENPITASFTPPTTTHLPSDIAKRIGEHPIQNSEDVLRLTKHGFDIRRLKSVLSFLFFTAGIFIAAFLINQFIFQSYYVEGTSMTPTLQNNDRLIISKVERSLSAIQSQPYIPERGQIVVLDSSIVGLNGQKEQLIKRVIGLPGDRIHIENGVVIITNAEHPEGYDVTKNLGLTNLQPTYSESPIDLTVPAGHVYVMGDNREQGGSYDSRSFGPIDGNKIQGRLWGRILPLDKAHLF